MFDENWRNFGSGVLPVGLTANHVKSAFGGIFISFYRIPWDYDNTFGIDDFKTQWQHADILDWASNTRNYYQGKGTANYLESDTPHGQPFTGRQFSNHQVYLNGLKQYELSGWNNKVEGIIHYVRMRHDSARKQLKQLRKT